MDSRDMLIIGAVAVAAFLYYRAHQTPGAVPFPVGRGVGASVMTASGAATTTPAIRSPVLSMLGEGMQSTFGGFSAYNMGGLRFVGSTASAVISDSLAPSPVRRAPVVSTPTIVGGAGVYPAGASSMGPQPPTTTIMNMSTFNRRY